MFKRKKLSNLHQTQNLANQIKRARILVIDDDENAFPVELLKLEGYNVLYWDKVTSFTPLENGEFDIIVLDLNNVASQEQSLEDGIGILKHIKSYNPSQIVVAYSAQSYDFKQADFWKLADDYLGKPSSLDNAKQKIDQLLQSRYNAEYYWGKLKEVLVDLDVPQRRINKLEARIVAAAESNKMISDSDMGSILKLSLDSMSSVATIVGVIFKILNHGSA